MAGISTTISPRAIMTGEILNYNRHVAIPFGQYFQIRKKRRMETAQDFSLGMLFAWVPDETRRVD